MGIKICPECGGKVSESRMDCPHCGFDFHTTKQCPDCLEFVKKDFGECPICGYYFPYPAIEVVASKNDEEKQEEFEIKEGVLIKYLGKETSVIVPNQVKKIGNEAFINCRNINEIALPDCIEEIGDKAFYYCTSLSKISIPKATSTLGKEVFYGCRSLNELFIPKNVIKMGDFAFFKCFNLTIFCEAKSKPDSWSQYWATIDNKVVWGYNRND